MKSKKLLEDFVAYCLKHPELRFWQALASWSSSDFVLMKKDGMLQDAFYSEKKTGL